MSTPLISNTIPAELIDRSAIARQAIVDGERNVFGYELFDRSITPSSLTPHTAASDAALLFNVLSYADGGLMLGRKAIFINCTHQTLASGHLELVQPERVILEIPPLSDASAEDIEVHGLTLSEIAKRGFKLAFDYSVLTSAYASWLPLASFIKIDMTDLIADAVTSVVQLARQHPHARLIAEKVETARQYELAAGLGVGLFQGYWFATPVIVTGQTIHPAQAAIIHLINLVRKQASTAEIEEVLKRDPKLSFKLLRFINSSGFGLDREITSFRHAVMILGLKKLFRWAALLLTTSRGGGSSAVGNLAVVRGRLMELLVEQHLPPQECDNAFVVGVFSLLDTIIGMPLDQALASISLPESVVNALLLGGGVLGPYLALAKACESEDDEAFAAANSTLKLTNNQVNMAHLQALAWVEILGE